MPTIRSSRVVVGGELRPATVRFEGGEIVDVFEGPADEDMGDLMILPGLVDTHVHVNEPGRTEWEGFESATRAAAAGGTTTIVDMPLNSVPPTVDVAALDAKEEAAMGKLSVDVAFWGGVVPGSAGNVASLVDRGVCGFKVFMVDSGVEEFQPLDGISLTDALRAIAAGGVPALIHAESPGLLMDLESTSSYTSYMRSRPQQAEADAIHTVASAARAAGASVHILHVSSADAVDAIAVTGISGETCPHYLTFAAEEIPEGGTLFKCAPPIREREHRESLWEALGAGRLSMVVSDHSPAPPGMKALASGDFAAAWGGISSLQLRLSAVWTGAVERGFGPVELARWMSLEPALLAGLSERKGEIRAGMDADLIVFDPDGVTDVRGKELLHRHPLTPYEGMRLRGAVIRTLLRGEVVFDGSPWPGRGRMLARS